MESKLEDSHEHTDTTSILNPFKFIENHYFSLPSQGNVYTLVPLTSSAENCKILVASLKKKIFCIEYFNEKYIVHENPLPCIPSTADIVSMNAYTRSNKFNIGLTLIMKDGSTEQSILNFYSDWDLEENGTSLTQGATNFASLPLNYIPYCLYYTRLPTLDGHETVWLLSGSDWVMHLFRFEDVSGQHQEAPLDHRHFPEFDNGQGVTLHLDILYAADGKSRTTATSGESGAVQLFQVDVSIPGREPVVKATRHIGFDFPSSAIKIFHHRNTRHRWPDSVGRDEGAFQSPSVLVTTTLESCFVHKSLSTSGAGFALPESETFDVVTSCLVCDLDFDGVNEVIVGTYGQMILIYKERCAKWELVQKLCVPSPVLGLGHEDVLGDGVCELIVSTMAGVHVFQRDPRLLSSLVLSRLRKMSILEEY